VIAAGVPVYWIWQRLTDRGRRPGDGGQSGAGGQPEIEGQGV
jgi:hypothetical protein